MHMFISDSHPRKRSLDLRHRLTNGFRKGLVADAGLIAHGRGECFDYLLGEKTCVQAARAEKAAAAALLSAENPVISVNGNAAAMVPRGLALLSKATWAKIEVNLFYRTPARERRIAAYLKKNGVKKVYGLSKKHRIPGLGSERANVDDPLWKADVVLLFLEDGDRTEAVKKMGKKVVVVDLNPLSRTARKADITIVDNIARAVPAMVRQARKLKGVGSKRLTRMVKAFDNKRNLKEMERLIRRG
ncbi:MAG: phosphopantothenate/pantothenate synthetase [Candidatus Altiarchaeota archaeon]|nr:phosphopantothenate/pantothenate synthetase [Candidatus Altiarchaeota archaeon]